MTYVAHFDGTNDYAELANTADLQTPTTALTMAGWVYRHGAGQTWGTLAAKTRANSDPYSSYSIYQAASSTGVYQGQVASSTTSYNSGDSNVLPADAWTFVALTWNSGGVVRLRFWNAAGTLLTNVSAASFTGSLSYSTFPFNLGGISGEVSATRIACWGIHNAVLTDAQLITDANSWFNTGRPPVTLSGPFWPLNNTWANSATYGASGANTLVPQNGATFADVTVPWTEPGGGPTYVDDSATETLTLTDSVDVDGAYENDVTESLTITDSVEQLADIINDLLESLSVSEAVDSEIEFDFPDELLVVTDSVVEDVATAPGSYTNDVYEELLVAESFSLLDTLQNDISEGLSVTDSVSEGLIGDRLPTRRGLHTGTRIGL